MIGVPEDQRDQNGDAYDAHTNVRGMRCRDRFTAPDCVLIDAVLRAELDETSGTDEWRAWVARAAARRGIAA